MSEIKIQTRYTKKKCFDKKVHNLSATSNLGSQYDAQLRDAVQYSLPRSSSAINWHTPPSLFTIQNVLCDDYAQREGGGVISSEATPLGVIRSRLLPLL